MYKKFGDLAQAKTEISTLFNIKSSAKSLSNFWKPEFERPGKYFLYVEKYLKFYIQLIEETHDVVCLKNLAKKVKKADDVLINASEIWNIMFRYMLKIQC